MSEEKYHLRRIERDLPDRAEQLAVLHGQKYLSLAMADENRPYLVSLNYAYSEEENCFFVHSAPQGRKIEMLRRNPRAWGQVIEDRGYIPGRCSHSYRSVMFEARAEFVADLDEKRRALSLMIVHADPDAAQSLQDRLVATSDLAQVAVLRLVVLSMNGKQGQ